ncbi:hypothetical protein A3A66_01030 [Microgenomates group bacterium RIFCSPLOWO2_01_FULL_46_13]|nr:MAG: hypothetical protein A2783_01225 [Microgenomates group bacterium RIFCSPHIGHO2_01_FULL_45_11]OGV94589.1 MAG: hypothetical protein A3A66_01030 [Microgenomates group bacterium RIFCSPLOWO2_01_FULL_46_13]
MAMGINWWLHIQSLLEVWRKTVECQPHTRENTGNINVGGEISAVIDIAVEEAFLAYIKAHNLPVQVFSEEHGLIDCYSQPKYFLAFDPLDGTTNYKIGRNLLAFGTFVAVFNGLEPKLADIVAAGMYEYTRKLGWLYVDGKTYDLNKRKVKIKDDWVNDISTPVYLDLYHKQGFSEYRSISKKLFIRNEGSTVGNLRNVLANVAAAMALRQNKIEEVGAIYGLITGVGGGVVDSSGRELGNKLLRDASNFQVLAGVPSTVKLMVRNLND